MALGLSALLHAALLVTVTSRQAVFDGEPIPIPIAWLEGATAGDAEAPGAPPGARAVTPPLEDRAPETEPEPPTPVAAPAPRPRTAPASHPMRAAVREPAVVVPAEIPQPDPAADVPAPTSRPRPALHAAPHAGARALETETGTSTGTETRTGTGTAGASAGGPGVASAPGSGRLVAGALPRARHRPAPVYPREARRRGHTGTSAIRLRIAADGRVLEARVHRTAGDAGLDAAALAAVRRWRFEPSPPGVDWTEQWFLVPIEFRLQ